MSRIGKKPILIPENVEVKIEGQKVSIKGPKGELSMEVRPEIKVEQKEEKIIVTTALETKRTGAFWGLTRALLQNMAKGVTEGFEKKLSMEGVGHRAKLEGEELILQVGFSHPVKITPPPGIKFTLDKNIIIISGISKGLVGEIAAKIRAVKPPEPYKGKGIRYFGEYVRRKAGKKAATASK